jgi:hypothetical protein
MHFNPEDGGSMILRNIGIHLHDYTVSQPIIPQYDTNPWLFFLNFLGWSETVHLVRRPLIGLLYQPRMIVDECGAVGGMRIGRGNQNIRTKPAPVPFRPPQIPHDMTLARDRVAAVGSRQTNRLSYGRTLILAFASLDVCTTGVTSPEDTSRSNMLTQGLTELNVSGNLIIFLH